MRDWDEEGEAEAGVHGCAVGAVVRTAEGGVQRGVYAEQGEDRDERVVCDLQRWRAEEAVVYAGDGGAPHEDDDAELGVCMLVGWADESLVGCNVRSRVGCRIRGRLRCGC